MRAIIAFVAAAAMILAGCADDTPESPDEPDVEQPEEAPAEPEQPEHTAEEQPDPDEGDQTEPVDGEPETDGSQYDGTGGLLAVVEVRVGRHDGFDRVVFELQGDGEAGWFVEYGEPRSQGSGDRVEVAGDATLVVAVHGVAYPFDLPDGVEPWTGDRVDGTGEAVTEVVNDTIFEGLHTFFIGTTAELPFVIGRFDDPQRIVIDIFHGM